MRLAIGIIDALRAILTARVASIVTIVEVTWLKLGRAIENASVVVEEQVFRRIAFGAEVGSILAVLAGSVVAVVATQCICNVIGDAVLTINALADGSQGRGNLLKSSLATEAVSG